MNQREDRTRLHINFELSNNLNSVQHKLTEKYGHRELATCRNQILSLIGYKYLSQNAETNNGDIGYELNDKYYYKNLLLNKGNVKEILKKGVEEITQENDNVQAADVFYDLFDLMDFETFPNNEDWLFFIDLLELLGRETTATLGQTFNFIVQYPQRTKNNIYQLKPNEILATVITANQKDVENLYDPNADCGSLMVEISNKINVKNYYGQHVMFDKCVLAKLNLLVNDVNYKNIFIKHNDIVNPNKWDEQKFDLCASIPLFGRRDANVLANDERFKPFSPKHASELAYILDMLYNLEDKGSIGVIVPQGLLFRGGIENKIIKHLVDNQFISTIIGLPGGLFDEAQIPTTLIVLDKKAKEEIFYLNIMDSIEGQDINKLTLLKLNEYLPILAEHKEVKSLSKIATIDEIKKNDYNLSINRYIELETLNKIDITKTIENIDLIKKELEKVDEELNTKIESLFK